MAENGDKVPVPTDQPTEEERGWREVADRWREVGQRVRDLSERLATAFREGWAVEEMTEKEARGVADQLRGLGERMDRAVDSVREEAKRPETKARAKETMYKTRAASRDLFEELEETLNEGLEDLNRRVDEVLARRKKEEGESGDEG